MDEKAASAFNTDRKPKNLSDYVTEELKTAILTGVFKSGEKLSTDKVAALLDVSRMPVREAMCRLEAMGIIEVMDGRGSMVRGISPERLNRLTEARNLIEPWIARLAAERRTDRQLAELQGIFLNSKKLLESNEMPRYILSNFDFHRKIAELADNEFLTEALERMILLATLVWNQDIEDHTLFVPGVHEHEELLKCLERRDGAAAMQAMSLHLSNNLRRVSEAWDRGGASDREKAESAWNQE